MFSFFKNKEKCLVHSWVLTDFKGFYDFMSKKINHEYKLTCSKCNKKNSVTEYNYKKMKEVGLIK